VKLEELWINITYQNSTQEPCTDTAAILVNDTAIQMTGLGSWCNVTKRVNSTAGATIKWKEYVNDISNNWNTSGIASYVTTSAVQDYDTSFNISTPPNYNWIHAAGTSEGSATVLSLLSFNFTNIIQSNAQPYVNGSSSNSQSGTMVPAFYIDNVGNASINISVSFSSYTPFNITVWANATCSGTYTSCQPTLQVINDSYVKLISQLSQTNSFTNITFYADVSKGASVTQTSLTLYVKSEIG